MASPSLSISLAIARFSLLTVVISTASPSTIPTTKWPSVPPTSTAPVSLKLCQYSGYCATSSDCVPGNRCNIQSVYYSQCMPDPSTYATLTGRLSNYGGKCSSTSQCADPGAYCDLSESFPQCKQPVSSKGLCIDARSFPSLLPTEKPSVVPTSAPTAKATLKPTVSPTTFSPTFAPTSVPSREPTANPTGIPTVSITWTPSHLPSSLPTTFLPTSTQPSNFPTMTSAEPTTKWPSAPPTSATPASLKLCQYSGYCATSSDCVPGNRCNIQSVYFSQCMPDPSTYATLTGSLSNYGGKCSSTSQCADPGAYCDLSESFPQCKQPVSCKGLCIDAHEYASPIFISLSPTTTNPIEEPTELPTAPTKSPTAEPTGPSIAPTEEPTAPTFPPTEMPSSPSQSPSNEPSSETTISPSFIPTSTTAPTTPIFANTIPNLNRVGNFPSGSFIVNSSTLPPAPANVELILLDATTAANYFNVDSSSAYFISGASQNMYFLLPRTAQSFNRFKAEVAAAAASAKKKKTEETRVQRCKEGIECTTTTAVTTTTTAATTTTTTDSTAQQRLEESFHLAAIGQLRLNGAAVRFGNATTSSSLTVVKLYYIKSTQDGSLLYGFVFETPVDICPLISSPIRYTTVTVNTYALVSTQQSAQLLLSEASQTVINVVCGDPPPAMNGGGIVAGDCNNGEVAGTDTTVVRFFSMGIPLQKFKFSYQTYGVKDRVRIYSGNSLIFDSQCVGTGVEVGAELQMTDPSSDTIKVAVTPNCECSNPFVNCGTAWYFIVGCVPPVIFSNGILVGTGAPNTGPFARSECAVATSATAMNTLYIGADAKMPDIQAQSAGMATWSVEFCYTGTRAKAPKYVNPAYSKIINGVSSLRQNWDLDSALNSYVVGGTAVASAVLKGETYTILFYIRGTNPTVVDIRAYLNSLGNAPFYFGAIISQSSSKQFDVRDNRLPLQTLENAFGLTQLTNPVPAYNEVFSWKANVQAGVSFYLNEKLSYGRRKINTERAKCQKALGAQCPPIPTITYGNCVFTDVVGSRLTFADAVGIKYYYNKNGGDDFVQWDDKIRVWKFNVVNNFNRNDVQDVCRFV